MKKHLLTLLFIPLIALASCGSEPATQPKEEPEPEQKQEPEPKEQTLQEKYRTHRETSLLADANFENGFYLISPESTNQYKEKDLDYDGAANNVTYGKGERVNYWDMCQWWTPFNFKEATYKKEGDFHTYSNESRYLGVNTKTSELVMKLDADAEYKEKYEDGVLPPGGSWSHFLIQQSFPDELKLSPSTINNAEEGLHCTFDITINEVTYKGKGEPVGADCAQLMFYFILRNYPPKDGDPKEYGYSGNRIWFGLPIYDSRYKTIDKYVALDAGFEGATNALIYNLPSKLYLGNSALEMNKNYHVDIDVLEYLQEAFVYSAQNNYLPNCRWENMKVDYMNFGWEIPGNYSVCSTLKNLDIYVA